MSTQQRLQEFALRCGWSVGKRIPRTVTRPVAGGIGRIAVGAGLVETTAWRRNISDVTGSEPTRAQAARAISLYARYFLEMLSLPGWDPRDIGDVVVISRDDFRRMRDDLFGPGAVLALGHLGNWDLAGAWACRHGFPVTSVAEVLPGSAYDDFLRYRTRLGFRIYGHRDPGVVDHLVRDAREHRLVCLLADRDLKRRGVAVRWPTVAGSRAVTMPVGPALVAQRSGATLQALALRYEGPRMIMDFSGHIPTGAGPDGVRDATQQVADHLGAAVARDPAQWHVLQPFFSDQP